MAELCRSQFSAPLADPHVGQAGRRGSAGAQRPGPTVLLAGVTGKGTPMPKRQLAIAGVALAALVPVTAWHFVSSAGAENPKEVPFDDARLKIEFNSTDGDAGLQVFADAEAWRHVTVTNPQGHKVLDVDAAQVIRNFGLSELFSESSEPSFDVLPFADFKRLFPAGVYTFRGQGIDGQELKSTFTLTHAIPDGPKITSPADGATLPANGVTVRWQPVTTPAGVHIVAYELIVIADHSGLGTAERTVDVTLPPTATDLAVPPQFLTPGGYKTEVLAIERSGNQTLAEVAFTVT